MALDKYLVSASFMVVAFEKVVKADFVERGARGERGYVTTNGDSGSLGSVNHDCCVPAHPSAICAFNLLIAWKLWLIFRRDRVDVVSGRYQGNVEL